MSSKRRLRRKACGTKVRHINLEAARVHIQAIRRKQPGTPFLNVYRCQFCNGYHIGHAPGSGLRRS